MCFTSESWNVNIVDGVSHSRSSAVALNQNKVLAPTTPDFGAETRGFQLLQLPPLTRHLLYALRLFSIASPTVVLYLHNAFALIHYHTYKKSHYGEP
jgi:hypothetical protein